MRILVEPSDYVLLNAGDTAMLQVAILRLAKLWPEAIIQVFTNAPDLLPIFSPNAIPLDAKGREIWCTGNFLLGKFLYYLPESMRLNVYQWEYFLRRRWPILVKWILKARLKLLGKTTKDLDNFFAAVSQADLVIATGMGGITDVFPEYAFHLLHTLRLGIQNGAVTVIMGQGIGPLKDKQLRVQVKEVLSQLDLIALREEKRSRSILSSLGIAMERVLITGDDAIEMAYQLQTSDDNITGQGLGVNLRVTDYSEVDENIIGQFRHILQEKAKKYQAPIVPVPISLYPGEDIDTIDKIVKGYENILDTGIEINRPLKVIEQIKYCRVVVTGSYHAGVFALSLGIPVVAIAKSIYYVDKFMGLAEQFGRGCQVILLNNADWDKQLDNAIEQAWQSVEQVKPHLLLAAKRQINLGNEAYQQVYEIVNKSFNINK